MFDIVEDILHIDVLLQLDFKVDSELYQRFFGKYPEKLMGQLGNASRVSGIVVIGALALHLWWVGQPTAIYL